MTAHRLPAHIVSKINDSILSARLTHANFDSMAEGKSITVTEAWKGSTPKTYESMTQLIQEKVSLHHSSWVIGPLESILEWSSSTDDGSMKEYDILGRLRSPFPNPEVLEQAHKEIQTLRDEVISLRNFRRAVEEGLKKID